MMKLIQFFDQRDHVIYVNPETISYLEEEDGATEITFADGVQVTVQENMKIVLDRLEQSHELGEFITESTWTIKKEDESNA